MPKATAERGYTARKEADGTYTLLDLEIMVEHEAPEDGVYRGREWMQKAIEFDKALHAVNKHEGRVHVRHNSKITPAIGKGYLELTDVVRMKLASQRVIDPKDSSKNKIVIEEKDVMRSNFRGLTEQDVMEFAAKKYPYRSAEFSLKEPHVMGVAVLETEPSFWQFPLTTVDGIEQDGKFTKFDGTAARIASYASAAHRAMLFQIDKPEPKEPATREEKTVKPDPDKILDRMCRMMTHISKHFGYRDEEDKPAEEPPPDKVGEGPANEDKKKEEAKRAMETNDEMLKRIAASDAKADLASAEVKKMQAKTHRDEVLANTKKALASYVIPEGRLEEKFDKEGEPAMLAYAQAIREFATAAPGPETPATSAQRITGTNDGGELKEFLAQGPEIAAAALREAKFYEPRLFPIGKDGKPKVSLKQFVATRLEQAALAKQFP